MADAIVSTYYEAYQVAAKLWDAYEAMVTLQTPYLREITTVSNAINGCLGVHNVLKTQPQTPYWLYSLVLSLMTSFGGGIVVPIFAGKSSFVFHNDFVLVACTLVWFIMNNLQGHVFFSLPIVRVIWMFFLGIFRTNAAVNMVVVANTVFLPTKYYPTPLTGPIVLGTLIGCFGQFLPLDKGLTPIKSNTAWPIQAAFFSSAFYHLMINDHTGCLGVTLRALIGSYSPSTVMMIIASVQTTQVFAQYFLHPEANIFTPIHKLLYLIFQVEGPKAAPTSSASTDYVGWNIAIRERLHFLLNLGRVCLVLLAVGCHIFLMVVPPTLSASSLPSFSPARPFPAFLFPTTPNAKMSSTVGVDVMNVTYPNMVTWTRQMYRQHIERVSLPLHHSMGICHWLQPSILRSSSCHAYFLKFELISDSETFHSKNGDIAAFRLAVYEKPINKLVWDDAVQSLTPLYTSPLLQINTTHFATNVSVSNSMQYALEKAQMVVSEEGFVYLVVAPIIDHTNIFRLGTLAQPITLFYYPWMKIAPPATVSGNSSEHDEAVCGQLFPSSVDSTTAEHDKKDANNSNKKNSGKNNVNQYQALLQQHSEHNAGFASVTPFFQQNPVTFLAFQATTGQVVASCQPRTSTRLEKMVLSLPTHVSNSWKGLQMTWNTIVDQVLPSDEPARLIKTEL